MVRSGDQSHTGRDREQHFAKVTACCTREAKPSAADLILSDALVRVHP